jgi:hypothetical protein
MRVPQHLKHQPIVVVDDYNIIGEKNKDSDAKGLSIGKSLWNEDEISAKVWRHVEKTQRWSRQSEELPLHRVLDLAILIVSLYKSNINQSTSLKETVLNENDLLKVQDFLKENEEDLIPRLKELKELLKEIK